MKRNSETKNYSEDPYNNEVHVNCKNCSKRKIGLIILILGIYFIYN